MSDDVERPGDELPAGADGPGQRRAALARLCLDSRNAERLVGFRGPGMAQRRLLYRAPYSFLEIALPSELDEYDPGWVCGQWFIQSEDGWRWSGPSKATLRKAGESEPLGEAVLDEERTFALPLSGAGEYEILLESMRGVPIAMEFGS